MGYIEAKEDGIKIIDRKKTTSLTAYYPRCCICNKEVLSYSYIRRFKYTCHECKTKQYMQDKEHKQNFFI